MDSKAAPQHDLFENQTMFVFLKKGDLQGDLPLQGGPALHPPQLYSTRIAASRARLGTRYLLSSGSFVMGDVL
jgi:hypothetical protein